MDKIGFRRTGTREEEIPVTTPKTESKQTPPAEEAVASIELFLTYGVVATAYVVGEQVVLVRNTKTVRTH